MPTVQHQIYLITRTLENDTYFSEVLKMAEPVVIDWKEFPRPASYTDSNRLSVNNSINQAGAILRTGTPAELLHTEVPSDPQITRYDIEVGPPDNSPGWRKPVNLTFRVVNWLHGETMAVAWVPELDIAVLAEKPELLRDRVVGEIEFALIRERQAKSLRSLATLQRAVSTELGSQTLTLDLASPLMRHKKMTAAERVDPAATLKQVGTDLLRTPLSTAYKVDSLVSRLADLVKSVRPAVLLVGPSGAGKTAVLLQLVKERRTYGLSSRPFFSTSGAKLIAGMGGFGMWQERLRNLCREAVANRAVLHVGNLVELMEVGKSRYSQIGIASFLKPYLLKGELCLIAECTPEELPFVEREDPHLLQGFQQLEIAEPDESAAHEILFNVALEYSPSNGDSVSLEALDLLDRLHRRYATYSAYPGRPLRFLKNLLKDADADNVVDTVAVLKSFARETGMPLILLDENSALDLKETAAWFAARIMGQSSAINRLVDLLAIIKARLARPGKPLASLLFAGPTGVGKTETAKVLAEYLYGDRERLIRFDMSEYASPESAERLIGGSGQTEGQLTARIREEPFSVLLLDEFEKADNALYDLLLQVMGEGRLTDRQGRTADFRNAIIIMTSNLGAESYQRGKIGFADKPDFQADARQHFTGEVRKFLRPEMFNRIDAVISFSPLDQTTVLSITQRELDLIKRRDGMRLQDIDLEFTADVAPFFAAQGFDPRYGARPIKRAVERELVIPLANRISAQPTATGLTGRISVSENRLEIDIRSQLQSAQERKQQKGMTRSVIAFTGDCSQFIRSTQHVLNTRSVRELENDLSRLRLLQRPTSKKRQRKLRQKKVQKELQRLPELQKLADDIQAFKDRAFSFEEELLMDLYDKREMIVTDYKYRLQELKNEGNQLILRLYALSFEQTDRVTVAVYSQDPEALLFLFKAYVEVACEIDGATLIARYLRLVERRSPNRPEMNMNNIDDIQHFLARELPAGSFGLIMHLTAPMAYPFFEEETGLHVVAKRWTERKCYVDVTASPFKDYPPPSGVERISNLPRMKKRRLYNLTDREIEDFGPCKGEFPLNPAHAHQSLQEIMAKTLKQLASDALRRTRR